MAEHIRIRKAPGTWVVRAAGAVIGESANALELSEGDYPEVIYFPRGDLAMALLEASETVTTCPYKGRATHFDLIAKSGRIRDAAWSYEDPKDDMAAIRDHVAFYPSRVTVEKL